MNIRDWNWFMEKFEAISGIDLHAYKRPQMERRINSFMRSVQAPDYSNFINLLLVDKEVFNQFVEHITINVSEFFRNASYWDVLAEKIVPALVENNSSIKIWSAGCSTGEEAYSLAIQACENRWKLRDKILATDLDSEVLMKAKAGIYSDRAVQGVPPPLLKKYFQSQDDNYIINEEIRDMVRFQKHDLLKDRFSNNFDLILCRNVVIYFTEETKQNLYHRFSSALRGGGILFIGSTEQIFNHRNMGLKTFSTFFYQKTV